MRQELRIVLEQQEFDVVGKSEDALNYHDESSQEPDLVLALLTKGQYERDSEVMLRELREEVPTTRLVAVAMESSWGLQQACIEGGADSFVPLTMPAEVFCQSLRVILLGENLFFAGIRPSWQRRQLKMLVDSPGKPKERRSAQRQRTLCKAKLTFNGAQSSMECVVLEISETGARIRPADFAPLPEQFDLRIKGEFVLPCQIVRRTGEYIGVQFVGKISVTAQMPPFYLNFAGEAAARLIDAGSERSSCVRY